MRRYVMILIFYMYSSVVMSAQLPSDFDNIVLIGHGICQIETGDGRGYFQCSVGVIRGEENFQYILIERPDHSPLYLLRKDMKSGETILIWSHKWVSV